MVPPQTQEAEFDPERDVNDYIVTVTEFDNKDDIGLIREFLRKLGTTGKLTVHLGQGGTQKIELEERTARADYPTGKRSAGLDFRK